MYIVVAILSFLFSMNAARASDIIIEKTEEAHRSPLKDGDINLIVVDQNNKKFQFFLHSEALQKSRYFNINFELSTKDKTSLENHLFHTPSIEIFKKILDFLNGWPIDFDSFEEIMSILSLQEYLEIDQLDEILCEAIKVNLEYFKTRELTQILKFAYRIHIPLGKKCSDIIFEYIALNHVAKSNCHKNELVKFLMGHPKIINIIDELIDEQDTSPIKNSSLSVLFEERVYYKAKKINEKNKWQEEDSLISVSNSLNETEKVVELLLIKYNISAIIINKSNGFNGKYKISIIQA